MKKYLIILPIFLVANALIMPNLFKAKKEKADFNKTRIICIGDSITFGAGVIFTRKKDSYPAILQSLLSDDYQVLNYGISGATLSRKGDTPYQEDFVIAAKDCKAEICIFMLGTNDSKPYNWDVKEYEKALTNAINEITNEDIKLYLMIPPRAFPKKGKEVAFDIKNDVIEQEIKPLITKNATNYNLELIDLYDLSNDHPEWFVDGVHPNKKGNEEIAKYVFEKINLL